MTDADQLAAEKIEQHHHNLVAAAHAVGVPEHELEAGEDTDSAKMTALTAKLGGGNASKMRKAYKSKQSSPEEDLARNIERSMALSSLIAKYAGVPAEKRADMHESEDSLDELADGLGGR